MRYKEIMLSFRCEKVLADWLEKSAEFCDCTRSEFIRLSLLDTAASDVKRKYFPDLNRSKKKSDKNR